MTRSVLDCTRGVELTLHGWIVREDDGDGDDDDDDDGDSTGE